MRLNTGIFSARFRESAAHRTLLTIQDSARELGSDWLIKARELFERAAWRLQIDHRLYRARALARRASRQLQIDHRLYRARQLARRVARIVQEQVGELSWRLKELPLPGRAEAVRCHGLTRSGVQCKRQAASGSKYCYQHRHQVQSEGRMFIVLEARDTAARVTSELTRMTRTAAVTASAHLAELSPKLRAQVLPRTSVSAIRRAVARATLAVRTRRREVTTAVVLAIVVVVPVAVARAAGVDLSALVGLTAQVGPGSFSSQGGQLGTGALSGDASGLPGVADALGPGANFTNAYVAGVEHLSDNSTLIQIAVPAGVEGDYRAIATATEGLEFDCVVLYHYTDRLYCVGPPLPSDVELNLKIYKLGMAGAADVLVFQADYSVGELAPPVPTQVAPTYGAGFTWPDRFDREEVRRQEGSSAVLAPLSALIGILLLLGRLAFTRRSLSAHTLRRTPRLGPIPQT